MPGLSIANNLLADQAQLQLEKNQASLKNAVTQLSSGLRINSAADDPSGLAISTTLQTQVRAFQQASQNVQNANNAAQVADGALSREIEILQRMRGLAVEASSSVNSASDDRNLQSEISQLILEINRISENTNFNGTALLDGSHSGYVPYVHASYTIASNAALSSDPSGSVASLGSGISNGDMSSPSEPANSYTVNAPITGWTMTGTYALYNGNLGGAQVTLPAGQQAVNLKVGATMSQTLTGLTPNATYQLTFQAATPTSGNLQVDAGSTSSTVSTNSSWQTFTVNFTADASGGATVKFATAGTHIDITAVALATTSGLIAGVTPVTSGATVFDSTTAGAVDGTIEMQVVQTGSASAAVQVSFFDSASGTQTIVAAQASGNSTVTVDGLQVGIGNVTAADAGATAYIKVHQAVASSTSAAGPLTIQSGADEGDTVQVGLQATNAQTLRVSAINLANTNAPVLSAEDAIGQLDYAIDSLLQQRAQLGAIMVALNEDVNNDNVAAVNLQASASAIRDLDVGQATTDFTKLEVLVQVGTSVLAQSNNNAQSVLGLFH